MAPSGPAGQAGLARQLLQEAAGFDDFLSLIYEEKKKLPARGTPWVESRVDAAAEQRAVPAPTAYPDLPKIGDEKPKVARTSPLRVLALHGTCASSSVFKKQLARMQTLLKGKIELIYVDGPIKADEDTPGYQAMLEAFKNMDFFDYARMADWSPTTPEMEELSAAIPDPWAFESYLKEKPEEHWRICPARKYEDLDTALEFLQEQLKANAPVDGVLGFGGGANMANLMAAQAAAGQGENFNFVVHLCPGRPGWVEQKPDLFANPIKMRCLCISGQRDHVNPPDALQDLYEDPICMMHEDNQRPIPGTSTEEANHIANTIVNFMMEEFAN